MVGVYPPLSRARANRAAFFLYRQRYQAAVVAQNPGLGSADISRIIGAQWRTLSEETKNGWHALANVCSLSPPLH